MGSSAGSRSAKLLAAWLVIIAWIGGVGEPLVVAVAATLESDSETEAEPTCVASSAAILIQSVSFFTPEEQWNGFAAVWLEHGNLADIAAVTVADVTVADVTVADVTGDNGGGGCQCGKAEAIDSCGDTA